MSKKIVINSCFGGFSLSDKAVLRARELSGNPHWGDTAFLGEAYDDGSICDFACGGHHPNVKRDDPILVQVVEELGQEANGHCASLKIVEVEGKYRIREYDGNEHVETPEMIQWEE